MWDRRLAGQAQCLLGRPRVSTYRECFGLRGRDSRTGDYRWNPGSDAEHCDLALAWSRVNVLVRHGEEDDDRYQEDVEVCGLDCELSDECICSAGGSLHESTPFGDGV